MEMESRLGPSMRTPLLIVSCILLSIGFCGSPLITRLYFIHGGSRLWLCAFSESAGFIISPFLLIVAYFVRGPKKSKMFYMNTHFILSAAVIGLLGGLISYLYAYGSSRLPVSTSSLILASQLAFTAVFAFLLVKQKFTSFSINAVVLLTMGAGMLAMHASSDRPKGDSKKQYLLGFVMTLGVSALNGLTFPLFELTFIKSKQSITYTLLMEFQMIIGLFGAILCGVGMIFNNDLKVIQREARDFGLGETRYYLVLAASGILWQCFTLGSAGVVCYGSSLLSGIVSTVMLPVTEVLAIIFYQEKFQSEKGVALFLSLWGFASYFYGEYKQDLKNSAEKTLSTDAATDV